MSSYKVGDKVRVKCEGGIPVGVITSVRTDPNPGYLVLLHFGETAGGHPMTAQSGLVQADCLTLVGEDAFNACARGRFNTTSKELKIKEDLEFWKKYM